jgi:hypothetical protein
MTESAELRVLKAAADPVCHQCGGEGIVCISWNGDPDKCEDLACDCAKHALVGLDEPHDPREAD